MKKTIFILLVFFGLAYWLWTSDRTAKAPAQPVEPPKATWSEPKPLTPEPISLKAPDPRIAILDAFFAKHKCADAGLTEYYLYVADSYNLDWRLLPALSFKEESCTRNAAKFNLWGWQSGEKAFTDFEQGIQYIGEQLANSKYYAGKTTKQKLEAYGPKNTGYADSVIKIMDSISRLEED